MNPHREAPEGAKPTSAYNRLSSRMKQAIADVEESIQQHLIRVSEEVGEIDHVEIDTRNFANYKVEIHLKD